VVLGLALVATHLEAVSARLLAGDRKAQPLTLPAEFDIPALQLMNHKAKRVGQWALKGVPTHYEPSGCKMVRKSYSKVTNTMGSTQMSISRCFGFCSKRKGLSYFGLTNGNECFCAAAIDASPLTKDKCDKPCPGNSQDMCGGFQSTNVYNMIDCTAATTAEKAQEAADEKKALISSYGAFNGETCGQDTDNVLQLDSKGFLSGSVDTCKIACWEGKGAENCHGFTYDSTMSKCTFHYDVVAGSVKKDANAACYFKVGR